MKAKRVKEEKKEGGKRKTGWWLTCSATDRNPRSGLSISKVSPSIGLKAVDSLCYVVQIFISKKKKEKEKRKRKERNVWLFLLLTNKERRQRQLSKPFAQ